MFRKVCKNAYFNPRSPYGERQALHIQRPRVDHFNPRSPYGERQAACNPSDTPVAISIHAPLTGSDDECPGYLPFPEDFNPRSPYGERLKIMDNAISGQIFQSTLPLRGATTAAIINRPCRMISIHAPLTGSDRYDGLPPVVAVISIHAPLTGSDLRIPSIIQSIKKFQSTLPLRGATYPGFRGDRLELFQSTLISIHAPLTGSDSSRPKIPIQPPKFQSTLPLRGATINFHNFTSKNRPISIHAPLTGSDPSPARICCRRGHFNPRSPYGERPIPQGNQKFLPGISIHAPLTGSDDLRRLRPHKKRGFQSTLPLRGATPARPRQMGAFQNFNPRSPYGERLAEDSRGWDTWYISIHAPLTGSDGCPNSLV